MLVTFRRIQLRQELLFRMLLRFLKRPCRFPHGGFDLQAAFQMQDHGRQEIGRGLLGILHNVIRDAKTQRFGRNPFITAPGNHQRWQIRTGFQNLSLNI